MDSERLMDEERLAINPDRTDASVYSQLINYSSPIGSKDSNDYFDECAASALESTESTYQQLQFRVVQVALDIGTTFSGCAFLFKHDYEDGQYRFYCNHWQDAGHTDNHEKTPTCLLLHNDTSFQSFGLTAINEYSELCMDDMQEEYFFFWNFKKGLHRQTEIAADLEVADISGKKLDALTVFTRTIEFFRHNLTKTIANAVPEIQEKEIGWVITVPAIWCDSAKKLVRLAAEKAGIPSANVDIALEPEAASLFCRINPLTRSRSATGLQSFPQGTRYLIADLGGGTADFAVHEVLRDNKLRELHKASGVYLGGNTVSANIWAFLATVVGEDVINEFSAEYKHDCLELIKEIDEKKRKAESKVVSIKLPSMLLRKFKERNGLEFNSECIPENIRTKNVHFTGDRLRVQHEQFKSFFDKTVFKIIDHINSLLDTFPRKIDVLLMVGGFSNCPVLQNEIKRTFENRMKIVIPPDASLCVMKGAVLFGFEPERITERISRYTYGIEQTVAFNPDKHPSSKKTLIDGQWMVDGVFDIHVRVGDVVRYGEFQSERVYLPMTSQDLHYSVTLYRSSETNPKFTDDKSCEPVGSFTINRPKRRSSSNEREEIKVNLAFGHSDIVAKVTASNGSTVKTEFTLR